jgi:hypothetical protein
VLDENAARLMENCNALLVIAGALFLVTLAIAQDLKLRRRCSSSRLAFAISANPDYFTTLNRRRSQASEQLVGGAQ